MPGVSRDNDTAEGDLIPSQSTVFANNELVIIDQDQVVPHAPGGIHGPPPPTMIAGSNNVFVNNKPIVNQGDKATCSHPSTASPNVNAGDPGQVITVTVNNQVISVFIPDDPTTAIEAAIPLIETAGVNAPSDDHFDNGAADGGGSGVGTGPVREGNFATTTNPTYTTDAASTTPPSPSATDSAPASNTSGNNNVATPTEAELADVYAIQLSPRFTVADMTLSAVFPHSIQAQKGFTVAQIVEHLRGLAINIMEPLADRWGMFRINSGFRRGTASSQHTNGMAVDVQWPADFDLGQRGQAAKMVEICQWCRDNLPVDQLIYEHGNFIWLHLSYDINKSSQRGQVLTYYPQVSPNYKAGITNYYA